jgi:IS6 family transposase
VQRFTPLLADAARFARHSPGDRWFVDETYVKVNGVWRYVYRADLPGRPGHRRAVLDPPGRRSRSSVLHPRATDLEGHPERGGHRRCAGLSGVLEQLVPSAWHHVEQYANNPIEADHGQLKRRLRPMRGLQTDRTAQVVIAGHAVVQNLRRGHYELGVDIRPALRVAAAFTELTQAI